MKTVAPRRLMFTANSKQYEDQINSFNWGCYWLFYAFTLVKEGNDEKGINRTKYELSSHKFGIAHQLRILVERRRNKNEIEY